MFTGKFDGKVENWFGKPLTELKKADGELNTTPFLKFAGTFQGFGVDKPYKNWTEDDYKSAYAEIQTANKMPDVKDLVKLVNGKELGKQRQAAMSAQVTAAGLQQPTSANDSALWIKTQAKLLEDSGFSEEDAIEEATAMKARLDARAAKKAAEAAENTEE
jgi:hypothetical protein